MDAMISRPLSRPDLVAVGQRWRRTNDAFPTVVSIEEITEEKLRPPVAALMPVQFAVCRVVSEGGRLRPGAIFEERLPSFGIEWWRLAEPGEHFATQDEARAAVIDGWPYACRRCGTYGCRRMNNRGGGIPTQEAVFFCPQHMAEWENLVRRQYEERKALL